MWEHIIHSRTVVPGSEPDSGNLFELDTQVRGAHE